MKIASHNSWSYLPPRKLWMLFVRPFSRCQDVDIRTQLALGVRMFDLRIKVVDGRVYMAHGLLEFGIDSVFADLYWIRKAGECYVRVLLENRNPSDNEVELFKDEVHRLTTLFPTIKWFGGHGAHGDDWYRHYVEFDEVVLYAEKHASVCADGIGRILPRRYARLHNREFKADANETWTMIDFVEL